MTTSVTAGLCAAAQTENIVRQLLERIPRHSGPGNLLREEISAVVAGCLDLVADEAMAPSVRMERIHRAAARWAGVGCRSRPCTGSCAKASDSTWTPISTIAKHRRCGAIRSIG